MSNGTPPTPPQGAPGTGYYIFVRPDAPGPGTVGVLFWSGTDYPTFLTEIDDAENSSKVIVALEADPPGFVPQPPPVRSCYYIYFMEGNPPTVGPMLHGGRAEDMTADLAGIEKLGWVVLASGFIFCDDPVPVYQPLPPPPSSPPPPPSPTPTPPPVTNPTDPTDDELMEILALLAAMLVALEAIQAVSTLESPDYTKQLATISTELNLIEKTLLTCCKSQSGTGGTNLDPVTCSQLTALAGNLAALLAGGIPPVNPTPPQPPGPLADKTYTVKAALDDLESAIEALPYANPQVTP